jgi:hypothetical protein
MRKPLSPNPYTDCIDVISLQRYKDVVAEYERRTDEYNAHIATLRKLPCSPEAVNSFRHGEVYELDKDFGILRGTNLINGSVSEIAVPLDPPKGDDPFPELLSRIATLFSEGKGNEEIAGVLREEWVISKK